MERAANDVNKLTGEGIAIVDDGVTPNSAGGTTGVASTTDTATGATVTRTLGNNPKNTIFFDQFGTTVPYDPGLLQPWTLTFKNGANTASTTTPSLVGVKPVPFASNVTVSGSSANPTFSWVFPAGSVDGAVVNIYEHLPAVSPGGSSSIDTVFAKSFPGTVSSFTVPTALAGGLSLLSGTLYTIDIYGAKLRNTTLPISNPNIESLSEAFFDFTPLPSGSPLVNLPSEPAPGVYKYSMTVKAGTTYFVDPTVAVGYSFATGAGDPNFASVVFPAVQTTPFDLSFLYDGTEFSDMVLPEAVFDFPTGGVSAFDVTGIDPADGLDPTDPTAFITGLTFVADGTFDGTQTALTGGVTAAPEPQSLALLAGGLLGLLAFRRGRRAAAAS